MVTEIATHSKTTLNVITFIQMTIEYAFNASTWEIGMRISVSSRPACSISKFQARQRYMIYETISQKKKILMMTEI